MSELILASGSPRRRELLERGGFVFRVETAAVPELGSAPDPRELPVLNATRKARAVAARNPDAWVLGADTVVLFQNQVIGKPRDLTEAGAILRRLAGAEHEVLTGVCLCGPGGREETFTAATRVRFKPCLPETIQRYLALVPVLDKAGAYAIQDHGELLIAGIDGSCDNVVGLPTEELFPRLEALRREYR